MEWSNKENRIAIIALHKCKVERARIFDLLKPLKIKRDFVYRTVKLFEDTGGVNDRNKSGRPRTARTPQAIGAVRSRITRKPVRKQRIMAREMNIAPRTMSRIIKQDLGLGAFRRQTGQRLTINLKKIGRKNQNGC